MYAGGMGGYTHIWSLGMGGYTHIRAISCRVQSSSERVYKEERNRQSVTLSFSLRSKQLQRRRRRRRRKRRKVGSKKLPTPLLIVMDVFDSSFCLSLSMFPYFLRNDLIRCLLFVPCH